MILPELFPLKVYPFSLNISKECNKKYAFSLTDLVFAVHATRFAHLPTYICIEPFSKTCM